MTLLPGAVVHNWRLKLSALGLSIFLWALVQAPRDAETISSVPVVLDVLDTAWMPAAAPTPGSVELRLLGPTREIIRLAREGTVVRVPVDAVGSSDTIVQLRRDWVVLADGSGLSVESVSPASVRLAFEPARSVVVPISARVEGELPANLAFASQVGLVPTMMRVRGAASRVEGLDSIRLRTFDLSTVEASGVFEVAPDTTGLGGARITPPTATLGIRVEEVLERRLSGLAVETTPLPGESALVVEPATVQVLLRGARTLVTAVNPRDLHAYVATEFVEDMVPGEERRVPLRVDGVPSLVTASADVDVVTVRRAIDGEGGGGQSP